MMFLGSSPGERRRKRKLLRGQLAGRAQLSGNERGIGL
jgi:hypothetical protein